MSVSKRNFAKLRGPFFAFDGTSPSSLTASSNTIEVLTHPQTLIRQKSQTQKMMPSWTQRGESGGHDAHVGKEGKI